MLILLAQTQPETFFTPSTLKALGAMVIFLIMVLVLWLLHSFYRRRLTSDSQDKTASMDDIKKLRDKGLISDEEYRKMSKLRTKRLMEKESIKKQSENSRQDSTEDDKSS